MDKRARGERHSYENNEQTHKQTSRQMHTNRQADRPTEMLFSVLIGKKFRKPENLVSFVRTDSFHFDESAPVRRNGIKT